jgi:Kef-type K+ transport system membrane component KefB
MTTRAFFNLLMIASVAYAARSFLPAGQTVTGSGAALAFGFLLIASLQIAKFADQVRFPHLTAYLLCGLFFGPQGLGFVSEAMVNDLALIKGTAVGLIALLAGCELNFRRLRPILRAITAISAITIGLCISMLWVLFLWITTLLPVTQGYSFMERAGIALVGANVLAAFSPSVVIGVIRETRASGPLSQLCISIVVLADLAMVVTFSISSSLARTSSSPAAAGMGVLFEHIFGSILIGLVIGGVLVLYVRRVHARTGLVVFALLFIVAEAGRVFHLDPLLVGLTAGLLLENASDVSGDEIVRVTEPVTLPTFVIFFAVVGAEIQLAAFLHVAPFAIVAALVRAFGVFVGSKIGSRIGGIDPALTNLVPLGLLPQAGVAIALAVLVLNDFEPWGRIVGTVLLGSIVVNELVGPVVFRAALAKAGEIGAATT